MYFTTFDGEHKSLTFYDNIGTAPISIGTTASQKMMIVKVFKREIFYQLHENAF